MLAAVARKQAAPTRLAVAVQASATCPPLRAFPSRHQPVKAARFPTRPTALRAFATSAQRRTDGPNSAARPPKESDATDESDAIPAEDMMSVGAHEKEHEHAVISAFDLFSIGVGPSSSHTVGPMRAGKIFIGDLEEVGLLDKVKTVKITLYGSLAATGSDPETIATGTIPSRYAGILENKTLMLGGRHRIVYDMDRDMVWRWDQVLKTHPNGMRFSVFGEDGDLLATNEYFRWIRGERENQRRVHVGVSGGMRVQPPWPTVDENLFYKGVDKSAVHGARLHQTNTEPVAGEVAQPSDPIQPPYPFTVRAFSGDSLLALTKRHNMTIAQVVYDNELHFGYSHEEIHEKLLRIWSVMDDCIRMGVSAADEKLPGRLGLRRRAPLLYRRLMRGFYPGLAAPTLPAIGGGAPVGNIGAPEGFGVDEPPVAPTKGLHAASSNGSSTAGPRPMRVVGVLDHPVTPMPVRKTMIPAMDFLSCYAIAVNEVNASGGRIVTSPTNGAAGVIPAVLKYIVEAVGMLFKRGSTISAAEGGCQAEVGVACSMASAGFAACMGASPETILQAAEIGIEHNLGLTCDPIDGLVQVPCIERNSLGAVKAITAAQLAMASQNVYSVTLDEAIEAMRLTASDMSFKYKETSLSGLARTVKIPLTVPAC
ncbi:L-serine ammonia-lyase [Epithele typhae]|uniref:L-serine ammonia-lyase n=1 Tax=Epithele typhae TaxID=378194 RepID=UPI00200740BD|nr:L-serine ammonia-lyase [Epithele typhae]KAH9935870.1 L-serine ammonia-lyase [Epithele typhae]